MKLIEMYGYKKSPEWTEAKSTLFGLECEIESVRSINLDSHEISVVEDGSLRNYGKEFLTSPAVTPATLDMFKHIHANIQKYNEYEQFSQRTSIHVHVNCLNLETDVISNIISLYALYEPMFFAMVDADRLHNIHCVPLSETFLPKVYGKGIKTMVKSWHKYTALNIKPLSELGTIEFRHMHGHKDPEKLKEWLDTIDRLFRVGKENMITPESLTPTEIQRTFMDIFGDTHVRNLGPSANVLLSNNIIDIKKMFI